MRGKHPIDELFRQGLHDAEAAPPTEAWAGIARALDDKGRRSVGRYGRWTLGLLLLLVGGAAGFWALSDSAVPERPTLGGMEQLPVESTPRTTLGLDAKTSLAEQAPGHAPLTTAHTAEDRNTDAGLAVDGQGPHAASERPATARPTTNERPVTVTTEQVPNISSGSTAPTMDQVGGIAEAASLPAPASEPKREDVLVAATNDQERTRKEDQMPVLPGRSSALPRADVTAPQGLLAVPLAVLPSLSGTRWWLAVQGEHHRGGLEWQGGEAGVAEALNTSETWLGRWTLSAVVGRSWRSGWSVGGGLSFSEARSRFLRTSSSPDHVETLIDTTWVSTPMGQQTLYTWNIVESTVVEPGTTQVARATNTYREARVFMEVGRRFWAHGRWSAHGRLSAGAIWTLARAGNTLQNTPDGGMTVLDLRDRTDGSGGAIRPHGGIAAELRYRLSPELALGVLPSIHMTFARTTGSTPSSGGVEAGGGLRLTYLLPAGRPSKPLTPSAPLE